MRSNKSLLMSQKSLLARSCRDLFVFHSSDITSNDEQVHSVVADKAAFDADERQLMQKLELQVRLANYKCSGGKDNECGNQPGCCAASAWDALLAMGHLPGGADGYESRQRTTKAKNFIGRLQVLV